MAWGSCASCGVSPSTSKPLLQGAQRRWQVMIFVRVLYSLTCSSAAAEVDYTVSIAAADAAHVADSHNASDVFPQRRRMDGEITMSIKFPRRDFFKMTPKQHLAAYAQAFKLPDPVYSADVYENGKLYHAQCLFVLRSATLRSSFDFHHHYISQISGSVLCIHMC